MEAYFTSAHIPALRLWALIRKVTILRTCSVERDVRAGEFYGVRSTLQKPRTSWTGSCAWSACRLDVRFSNPSSGSAQNHAQDQIK